MSRFGLRHKLLLLLVVPLATAIFFAGINFTTLFRQYGEISGALTVSEATLRVDRLMGGLQLELSLQKAVLTRSDQQLQAALEQVRAANDGLIEEFSNEVDSIDSGVVADDIAQIQEWRDAISGIQGFRQQVSKAGKPTARMALAEAQFREWIDAGNRILALGHSFRDATVGASGNRSQLLMQAQMAGFAEQSQVLQALHGGTFSSSQAALVARARGVNEDAIQTFKNLANDQPGLIESITRELAKADQSVLDRARTDLSYHLQKIALLNKLKVLTGYGGLIHDFKNYVMRGEAEYRTAFEEKAESVDRLIREMELLPGYPEVDAALLENLSETFAEYGGYFELVTTLQETDTPVEIIDQSVLVDDTLAQRSLIKLDDFHPRTPAFDWWSASSSSIAALEVVRGQEYAAVSEHLHAVQRRAELELWVYGLLLIAVVSIACALAVSVLRRTLHGITEVVRSMQALSLHGDLDVKLPAEGDDEIGQLSSAMRGLVTALKSIATQAEVIGEGDFRNEVLVRGERDRLALGFNRMVENTREVLVKAESIASGENVSIKPRGLNDQLGMALVRMNESLAAYAARTEDEQWVNQGQIELADASSVDEDEKGIGMRLIAQIARYIGADAGILWSWSGRGAEFLAGYGIEHLDRDSESNPQDAGLVRQAIHDEKTRVISRVPDGYFRIGSGLGSALPSSVLVAPLTVGNQTIGAIELAFFSVPSKRGKQFIETVRATAANALQRAQARSRLQELLETSRKQSEQLSKSEVTLKLRGEELMASNEELGEKTRLLESQASQLRASEEILRNQTEELQVTNEELSERGRELEQRTRQIQKAKEEVEEKAREVERASRYKSEFLANMSHELRTPLNSMLILSGILADNDEGNLSDDDVESVKIIHDSGNNLLALISDILDLSKVEAGKVELHYERLRLNDFLEVMRARYEPVAKSKKLDFKLEILDGAPEAIATDPMRFEQVVTNLLSNALKFTSQGEVALRISLAEATDAPDDLGDGEYLSVAVSDTGIGIPQEKVERVFNAFEQADGSTTREFGGTGLGLAISMQLANLLGGKVVVSSVEGKGSTFRLVIPLQPAEAQGLADLPEAIQQSPEPAMVLAGASPAQDISVATLAPEQPLPPPPFPDDREQLKPGEQSIVVIEDDVNFLRVLASTVRCNGISVLVATDGKAGLDLIRRYRPSGALLDVGLPDIDGWSVMERLKADPEVGNTPVHFVSGQDEEGRAEAMGAVGFAMKPLSREDIHSAMRRVLAGANQPGKRLLLIDDHPADRAQIVSQLSAEGLEIEQVDSADDALALLARGRDFSCIILDPQLQDKDGWQFLGEASEKGLQLPPVIVYTALELSDEQLDELQGRSIAVVLKNEASRQRLVDEATLFLHHIRKEAPADTPAVDETEPVAHDLDILKGKLALVVDDDMRNVFALSKVLRGKGMQTLKAPDGEKALQQLNDNAERVDIVLMDIMMPVMDGYDAMRELRKDPRFVDLPVIALTAKAMKGDRDACIAAGATDYQTKPVDVPQLFAKMAQCLSSASDPD